MGILNVEKQYIHRPKSETDDSNCFVCQRIKILIKQLLEWKFTAFYISGQIIMYGISHENMHVIFISDWHVSQLDNSEVLRVICYICMAK